MWRVLLWLAIGTIGIVLPVAADTVTVHNCDQEALRLRTFNQNDGVCWIARTEASLASCGTVTFTCDEQCKVEGISPVNYCGTMPRLSGVYVIPKGKAGDGAEYLQSPGQVNRWRGTPDWNLVCVCSEAQMQF